MRQVSSQYVHFALTLRYWAKIIPNWWELSLNSIRRSLKYVLYAKIYTRDQAEVKYCKIILWFYSIIISDFIYNHNTNRIYPHQHYDIMLSKKLFSLKKVFSVSMNAGNTSNQLFNIEHAIRYYFYRMRSNMKNNKY